MAIVKPVILEDGQLKTAGVGDQVPQSYVQGLDTALETKVDKVAGKGLSDTNFTQEEKTKLADIASGATKNRADSENADKVHNHTTEQVTGLDSALAGKVSNTDSRLTDSREWSAATVTQAEAEAGTASTRRAWTSQRVRQAINAWWQLVTSGFGRNLVSASTEADARTILQLGNAATHSYGAAANTIAQGNDPRIVNASQNGHTHPHTQVTGLGTAATKNVGTADGDVLPVGAYGIANYPVSRPTALEASSNGIIWSTTSTSDAVQCGVTISPLELTTRKFGIGFDLSSEEGFLTVNNGISLSTSKILTSRNIANSNYFGVQSPSDFPDGTLIRTSFPAASDGPSITLKVWGKGYGDLPHLIMVEAYQYDGGWYATSGINLSGSITNVTIMEVDGYVCFWFASTGYWNSFFVEAYDTGYQGSPGSRVTSVENSTKPAGTKVVDIPLEKTYNTTNLLNIGTTPASARAALQLTGEWVDLRPYLKPGFYYDSARNGRNPHPRIRKLSCGRVELDGIVSFNATSGPMPIGVFVNVPAQFRPTLTVGGLMFGDTVSPLSFGAVNWIVTGQVEYSPPAVHGDISMIPLTLTSPAQGGSVSLNGIYWFT